RGAPARDRAPVRSAAPARRAGWPARPVSGARAPRRGLPRGAPRRRPVAHALRPVRRRHVRVPAGGHEGRHRGHGHVRAPRSGHRVHLGAGAPRVHPPRDGGDLRRGADPRPQRGAAALAGLARGRKLGTFRGVLLPGRPV
ncbi:MAG: hypothetical protein AVDCRST_MAG11-3824, partial [uncultured Gemmatimonadaceae bacterium]